jgi:hypothetical protein
MAGFSYVQALSAGFRVLGRKPWVVLAWAVAYLVLAVLPLTLIVSQVLPDVVATYREAAHAVTQGMAPDPAKALALRSKVSGLQPLVLLIQLVAYTILTSAAFRAVLEPEASRWGYLRLGRRELWLGLSLVVFVLVFMVLVFTLLAILGVAVAVGIASAHSGHTPGPAALPLLKLIQVVCGLAIFWVMLRLSLALPMSFAENRFVFYEAWSLTRRQGWKLFLLGLTLLVLLLICDIAATLALRAVLVNQLAHAQSWRDTVYGTPATTLSQRLRPIMIGVALVGTVLGMGLFAILAAPFADIYRQLRGEPKAAA